MRIASKEGDNLASCFLAQAYQHLSLVSSNEASNSSSHTFTISSSLVWTSVDTHLLVTFSQVHLTITLSPCFAPRNHFRRTRDKELFAIKQVNAPTRFCAID